MSTTIATTPARHIVTGTPIGPLTVVRDDEGLTGVYFSGHWTRPDQSAFGPRAEAGDTRSFEETVAQLNEYLNGRRREFELPLAPHGDERAKAAWQLIARVPYGSTATYGSLASALGSGVTARQVGWYVGHNPLSIIIPCHRIIGADGSLTGYAGGLERKRHLLELEGAIQAAEPTLW
jgi:methylated-DNA-[protein]-cysteine S-methyltransferase